MTVKEAVEIRDRAKALGLESCCPQCAEAISRLEKLGTTGPYTLSGPPEQNPTYVQTQRREPTIGTGSEDAVRWLRRQIGAASVA